MPSTHYAHQHRHLGVGRLTIGVPGRLPISILLLGERQQQAWCCLSQAQVDLIK